MKTPIPTGDYFTCDDDAESLSHTEAVEAVGDYLDRLAGSGESEADTIRRVGSVELFVCVRKPGPTEAELNSWADMLLDSAEEYWSEEYGNCVDPDEPFDRFPGQGLVAAALRQHFSQREPWQCEQMASVELDADDLMELMGVKL